MQIGKVIRTYRKSKNMTQEEMANRLGVTAPAVNKWENGNSFPDIMLLAPIARLLGVTLDELLAFREELTNDEVNHLIVELADRLKNDSYHDAFRWAKEKLELYPNCENLMWQMAVVLDAKRLTADKQAGDEEGGNESDKEDRKEDNQKAETYEAYIRGCYVRLLESENENIRRSAADSLFGWYLRREDYQKAEEYLSYFSDQNPEKKRKQAVIYSKTDRIHEAYKAYEELLFSEYQMLSLLFHGVYMLAMQEEDKEKARMLIKKQSELAGTFEMGAYHEASCGLELAVLERDTDAVIEAVHTMLDDIRQVYGFRNSALYEHMDFKEGREEFLEETKRNLIESFRGDEAFDFLKEDKRWKELVK